MEREASVVNDCVASRREMAILGGGSKTTLVAIDGFSNEVDVVDFPRETICEMNRWAQSLDFCGLKEFSGLGRKGARLLPRSNREQMGSFDEPEAGCLVYVLIRERAHTYLNMLPFVLPDIRFDVVSIIGVHKISSEARGRCFEGTLGSVFWVGRRFVPSTSKQASSLQRSDYPVA